MGEKKSRGRPKTEHPRYKRLSVRLSEDEHKAVLEASKRMNISIADLFRNYIHDNFGV